MDKNTLRLKMKAVRKSIPDMEGVTKKICAGILSLDEIKRAETVFCYVSFGTEVGTHGLINALIGENKRVCVPKTYKDGNMVAVKIDSLSHLERSAFGVLEPSDGKIVEKVSVDIVIIPALCYDKLGYRLGYGKGFYDRYLKDYGGVKIGICPDECIVQSVYPERHDVCADIIVTQTGVFYLNEKRERA